MSPVTATKLAAVPKNREYARPSFLWVELECRCGCGTRFIQEEALDKLQALRDLLGKPLIINSAARCPVHNARVGGAPLSEHRSTADRPSSAFDISIVNVRKDDLIAAAEQVGFNGIGVNYKTFVHVDNRPRRARW